MCVRVLLLVCEGASERACAVQCMKVRKSNGGKQKCQGPRLPPRGYSLLPPPLVLGSFLALTWTDHMSCQVTTARQAASIYRARHLGRSETSLSSPLLASTHTSLHSLSPPSQAKGQRARTRGSRTHTAVGGKERQTNKRGTAPGRVLLRGCRSRAVRARAGEQQPSYYLSPASIPMPTYTPHLHRAAKPPPAVSNH